MSDQLSNHHCPDADFDLDVARKHPSTVLAAVLNPENPSSPTTDPPPPSQVREAQADPETNAPDAHVSTDPGEAPANDQPEAAGAAEGDAMASDGGTEIDDGDPCEDIGDPLDDPHVPPVDRSVLITRLADRSLHPALFAHVRAEYRMTRDTANDVVQTAFERAMRARTWPAENRPMLPWLKVIAKYAWFDHLRWRRVRSNVEISTDKVDRIVPRVDHDDEHAERAIRVAREVAAESPANHSALEMLAAQSQGASVAAIADRMALREKTAYARMSRYLARVRSRLTEASSAAAVAFAMVFLYLMFSSGRQVDSTVGAAAPRPGPSVGAAPSSHKSDDDLPPLPTPMDAGTLRQMGLGRCESHEYVRCLELLNRARRLDTDGDRDPAVQAARKEALASIGRSHPTP